MTATGTNVVIFKDLSKIRSRQFWTYFRTDGYFKLAPVLFEMSRNEQTFFSTIWCGSSIWRALGALPSTREGHTSPPCSAHQGSQS